jgi:large subunit ribosomal protein L18
MAKTKEEARLKRKDSIRKRVHGTAERPRLTVFRSAKHIYAQVVDDDAQKTLAATSTLAADVRESIGGMKKKDRAKKIGETIAKMCLSKGVAQVVFDRNGFIYHGRISALADGAREGGLKF